MNRRRTYLGRLTLPQYILRILQLSELALITRCRIATELFSTRVDIKIDASCLNHDARNEIFNLGSEPELDTLDFDCSPRY